MDHGENNSIKVKFKLISLFDNGCLAYNEMYLLEAKSLETIGSTRAVKFFEPKLASGTKFVSTGITFSQAIT